MKTYCMKPVNNSVFSNICNPILGTFVIGLVSIKYIRILWKYCRDVFMATLNQFLMCVHNYGYQSTPSDHMYQRSIKSAIQLLDTSEPVVCFDESVLY